MEKNRTIIWFSYFCTLGQYLRERKISIYIFSNLLGLLLPFGIIILWIQGYVETIACINLLFISRILPAPLDEYASEGYSYNELVRYPLKIRELLLLRCAAKFFMIAEWVYAGMLFHMIQSHVKHAPGSFLLTFLVLIDTYLFEEIIYFMIYISKNNPYLILFFELSCIIAGIITVAFQENLSALLEESIYMLPVVLIICIITVIILEKTKLKNFPNQRRYQERNKKKPPFCRLYKRLLHKSTLIRLSVIYSIILFRFRIWDIISATGYAIIFFFLSGNENMSFMIVPFFIIDYCFLVGFNFWGNNDTREGLFLSSLIDREIQLKSFHASLMTILIACSTFLTLVFSLIRMASVKNIILCIIVNLFCSSLMTIISSVLSCIHYYTDDSKKKYTVSNIVIMMFSSSICLTLSGMIFYGGKNICIAILVFMVLMKMSIDYILFIDDSLLILIFNKHLPTMWDIKNHPKA